MNYMDHMAFDNSEIMQEFEKIMKTADNGAPNLPDINKINETQKALENLGNTAKKVLGNPADDGDLKFKVKCYLCDKEEGINENLADDEKYICSGCTKNKIKANKLKNDLLKLASEFGLKGDHKGAYLIEKFIQKYIG